MMLLYSTMMLQLILIYCGAYNVVKQLLQAQSSQHIGKFHMALQFSMLFVFANVCFLGVWHAWLTDTQLYMAVLLFNAGMALPAACAHAMHIERLQKAKNPRNRVKAN